MNFIDALLDTPYSNKEYISIGDRIVEISKGTFKEFLLRINSFEKFTEALEKKQYPNAGSHLNEFLGYWNLGDISGLHEIHKIKLAFILNSFNQFTDIYPILQPSISLEIEDENQESVPYDYDGRTWAYWIHKLAKFYGWSKEQILNLNTDEIPAYIQECEIEEYVDYEKKRVLSEMAYHYDKNTKKSTYKPSPKPYWMAGATQMPKKIKINTVALPAGHIEDLSGLASKEWLDEQKDRNHNNQ